MDSDKKLLRYYLRSHIDANHHLTVNQGVNLSFEEVKGGKLTEESLELAQAKTSELKLKGELEYHICSFVLSKSDGQTVMTLRRRSFTRCLESNSYNNV